MRQHPGAVAFALLALTAAIARAQAPAGAGAAPTLEFGVDLTTYYTQIGGGCTTDCGLFSVGTPVDVRVGIVSGPLTVEPRLAATYITRPGSGHVLSLTSGLNVLVRMGPGTGQHNLMGVYLTGGGTYKLVDTGTSAHQFSVNVGVGDRVAFGSGAWRPEAFFRYNFKNSTVVSSWDVGVRLGLSLWH